MIKQLFERPLTTVSGEWREILFDDGSAECSVIVYGDVSGGAPVLSRVHSDCRAAHLLMSVECDCRDQMIMAQHSIVERGSGLVIALPQDGRGFGHKAQMMAMAQARATGRLQSEIYREVMGSEDGRDYRTAADVLRFLKVERIELLTNNPRKVKALEQYGVTVTTTMPLIVPKMLTSPQLQCSYLDKVFQGHLLEG